MKPLKLGLTRNRLFSPENCAVLCVYPAQTPDRAELNKALKMLSAKHPLITCSVVLDGADAVVTPDTANPQVETVDDNGQSAAADLQMQGLDFSERLFRFVLTRDNAVILCGHTAVCDCKTLLTLFSEWWAYNRRQTLDIEEAPVRLFSSEAELPVTVFSPVVDKTIDGLNFDWARSVRTFTAEDYRKAKAAYNAAREPVTTRTFVLNEDETAALSRACAANKIDVATAVAYVFRNELASVKKCKPKEDAVLWEADRRVFFGSEPAYDLGAYDGTTGVKMPRRGKTAPLSGFQKSAYQKLTSCFSTFYTDVFGMKLHPSLCDAAHLYAAGALRDTVAKKTAERYGSLDRRLLGYLFINLDSRFWSGKYADATVTPLPVFSQRTFFRLTALLQNGSLHLFFSARGQETTACEEAARKATERLKHADF